MKTFLKDVLRACITQTATLLNIDIVVARKKQDTDHVFVDRNILESFYHNDSYITLYNKGLVHAGMENTDHFLKQCRSYRLQQMLKHVLDKGLSGNVAECGCWKGHSSYIISEILAENDFKGKFSIFDSFEMGLSDKQEEDTNVRHKMSDEDIKNEKLLFSSGEDDLHRVLKSFNFY